MANIKLKLEKRKVRKESKKTTFLTWKTIQNISCWNIKTSSLTLMIRYRCAQSQPITYFFNTKSMFIYNFFCFVYIKLCDCKNRYKYIQLNKIKYFYNTLE